jgi:hypothetical protein
MFLYMAVLKEDDSEKICLLSILRCPNQAMYCCECPKSGGKF